jgi:anti-sigma factor RsiW
MNWNCTLTEERLSDVLDRLLLPEESAAFAAHLDTCRDCAHLVAHVGGIVSHVQQIPLIDEPPFLASRIIAVTRGTSERATKGWFGWSPSAWLTRMAMGGVSVAATFVIVFHAVGSGTPEKFHPANLFRDINRRAHLTYARGARFVNDLRVVYEIQSRLSPQPGPALEPTPPPRSNGRPDSDARPKSQPLPPSTHRAFRNASAFAVLTLAGETQNALEETPRSLP